MFQDLLLVVLLLASPLLIQQVQQDVLAQANTTTTEGNTTQYITTTTIDPNATLAPIPTLAMPEEIATPMLWAAGPVSVCAMLFGGSPVNGLYSTSALAVVEFSICYRDFVDQPLRFPETAWPGWTIGRAEGQHIRGAIVSNIICQISLVILLFCVGAVLATLKSQVKKRLRSRKARRAQKQAAFTSSLLAAQMAKQMEDDEDPEANLSLLDRVGIAVWYPGSYILVASIFLEGIVASIIRLCFVIGPDAVDIIISILGAIVVSQVMVVAWTVVSRTFHGGGPVRFCSGYVRVPKEYHESPITQFLRSQVASTFLLGNYLWCAKKGTEDSRNNVLPGPARPAGLIVMPFRARNPDESGVIALATRYFFVESCFAFVLAICRGILEPCEINIWIIAGVSFASTALLIRVRPFNIPFYNTTAVWANGAVTASALCIAFFYSGIAGRDARLAGEVIAMMAALGGSLPLFLYVVRSILMWAVNAELCPVGLQDEAEDGLGGDGGGGGSGKKSSTLEDDLELEAFLSNEKQPVNWPLRKAGELKLPSLPKNEFDDSNLFAKKDDGKGQRASIFSPEGQAEREKLRQKRPKQLDLGDEDEVISPISSPSVSVHASPSSGLSSSMRAGNSSMSGASPLMHRLGGGGGSGSPASSSPASAAAAGGASRNNSSSSPQGIIGSSRLSFASAKPSSVPGNLPKNDGSNPFMESYVG